MTNILLVGVGGFIGSVLRYLVSGWVQQSANRMDFPFGILAVNLIGCFIIGLLAQFGDKYGTFSNKFTRIFGHWRLGRLHHLFVLRQ